LRFSPAGQALFVILIALITIAGLAARVSSKSLQRPQRFHDSSSLVRR
jgi:hypothetical protein